jgi:diphthine synthase
LSAAHLGQSFRKSSKSHGELVLIGMGLWDHDGISYSGIRSARKVDDVYVELYTSIMPGLNLGLLERRIGKKITVLNRHDLEEGAEQGILKKAKDKNIALLVPGEPLAATTHVSLRLRAFELGITTKIIHSASIFTAAPSLTGLQHYKFGKTVTIPFPRENYLPLSTYDAIIENLERGLHTLVLLDIDTERRQYLSIGKALDLLLRIEGIREKGVFTGDRLVLGVARVGSPAPLVRCGTIRDLIELDFGAPPHILIVPGELHFMEAETLVKMFGAPKVILSKKPISE